MRNCILRKVDGSNQTRTSAFIKQQAFTWALAMQFKLTMWKIVERVWRTLGCPQQNRNVFSEHTNSIIKNAAQNTINNRHRVMSPEQEFYPFVQRPNRNMKFNIFSVATKWQFGIIGSHHQRFFWFSCGENTCMGGQRKQFRFSVTARTYGANNKSRASGDMIHKCTQFELALGRLCAVFSWSDRITYYASADSAVSLINIYFIVCLWWCGHRWLQMYNRKLRVLDTDSNNIRYNTKINNQIFRIKYYFVLARRWLCCVRSRLDVCKTIHHIVCLHVARGASVREITFILYFFLCMIVRENNNNNK